MKKVFMFFIGMVLVTSCETRNPVDSVEIDYNTECVKIYDNINKQTIVYNKIKLEGHDFYFRCDPLRDGITSDLIHNPNCSCFNDSIK